MGFQRHKLSENKFSSNFRPFAPAILWSDNLLLFTRSQQQAKIHENRLRRWDFCSLAQFNLRSAQQVRRPMWTV